MKNELYMPRIIDKQIKTYLSAFEIKLGANQIDKAAEELTALKKAIVRE